MSGGAGAELFIVKFTETGSDALPAELLRVTSRI